MSRSEKIIAILFLLCLFTILIWSCNEMVANAHEGHGFVHMKSGETTGPIIKAQYCPDGTLLNWIDYNNDGTVDACKKILFIHEKLHVKEFLPVDDDCTCDGDRD